MSRNNHECAKKFEEKFLDSEGSGISVSQIQNMNWNVLLAPDFPNFMEAEWLSESIISSVPHQAVGLAFEFQRRLDSSLISADRDSILQFCFDNSHRFACITDIDISFIYFKDEANRFTLLCGQDEFIKNAYRCSFETAKDMYFSWVEHDFNSDNEKQFLESNWQKYIGASKS